MRATIVGSRSGELTPASFSFNNPLGMCPDCSGLGTRAEMDRDLIVPDKTRSIRDGAVEVWASGMARGEGWTADLVDALAKVFSINWDALGEVAQEAGGRAALWGGR